MISLNMVKLGKMVNLICNLIFMVYEQYHHLLKAAAPTREAQEDLSNFWLFK